MVLSIDKEFIDFISIRGCGNGNFPFCIFIFALGLLSKIL